MCAAYRTKRTLPAPSSACAARPSLSGVKDVREALARAERGGMLDPRELLTIAGLLTNSRRVREYYEADQGEGTVLDRMFGSLHANRFLRRRSRPPSSPRTRSPTPPAPSWRISAVTSAAASAKGRQILQKIISSPELQQSTLQEALITQRDGPLRGAGQGRAPRRACPAWCTTSPPPGATLLRRAHGRGAGQQRAQGAGGQGEKGDRAHPLAHLSAEAAGFAERDSLGLRDARRSWTSSLPAAS